MSRQSCIADSRRRTRVCLLLTAPSAIIPLGEVNCKRGKELQALGLRFAHALQVASADSPSAEIFLMCDDMPTVCADRESRSGRAKFLPALTSVAKGRCPDVALR